MSDDLTRIARYANTNRTQEALDAEVQDLWAELATDDEARVALESKLGIDLSSANFEGQCPFSVEQETDGVGVGEAILIWVAYEIAAPVIKEVALDIWREFLLPRLKERFGQRALEGESVEEDPTS